MDIDSRTVIVILQCVTVLNNTKKTERYHNS